ncbi:hypothetical protein LEP1GSC096_1711 [Leptospira interrogans serovar Hebdomadis str. R499]|nr:hypothetical protein LEP1GSC087_3747 [Leptospira interrogans serovar Bataviae str. L1111]EKR38344.1 hypothetical protein LEP1GSC096_1711 [Leptospira interrogans serovar Hebdomadis str. R499]EMN34028.1 hypothetical protein LEP1GSC084_2037 [Leptospira interrogans serovar Medanensis str. L0448]EMN40006.1 hypothetical protein LEP1GSC085_0849 [Leptospira interrogans str. L0996]EMN71673.1 hypothetical protein LEP1GSC100_4794 [Leptospira interrogans serovar Bataviae str. UI 08561]EMN78434.1 hypoth
MSKISIAGCRSLIEPKNQRQKSHHIQSLNSKGIRLNLKPRLYSINIRIKMQDLKLESH